MTEYNKWLDDLLDDYEKFLNRNDAKYSFNVIELKKTKYMVRCVIETCIFDDIKLNLVTNELLLRIPHFMIMRCPNRIHVRHKTEPVDYCSNKNRIAFLGIIKE